MPIKGYDAYFNQAHMGGPKQGPSVRFGSFSVPWAVAWETEPIGKSPKVRAEFELKDGEPICTSVTFTQTEGGRGITTADLESLPGLDRKAIDAFKSMGTKVFDDDDWKAGRNLHRVDEIHNPDPKSISEALRGRPHSELSEIAAVYRQNVDGRPVEAVQDAFGLARRTADRRIKAARDAGLLPQTTRGRKQA